MRSATSISASRALFCVTSSPGRGAIRNRNTRGPASDAVNRTRTAAGSPSIGSFTSCEPTMRPSSSTSSVTVSPAKPVCVTTASITSDVPLSAVRGVDTRSTCTSLRERSRPDADGEHRHRRRLHRRAARRDSDASVVSAPSLTRTSPASGSPASSWRAPSSAAPSRVCAPANVRSSVEPRRAAADENRNVRSTNRSDSALTQRRVRRRTAA